MTTGIAADVSGEINPSLAHGHRAPEPEHNGAAARRRPRRMPLVAQPAPVTEPTHHHLPGWVKRSFAQARPPLGDLLALLTGESKDKLQGRVDEIAAGISAGKFSLAWQYPDIVKEGRAMYAEQDKEAQVNAKATQTLESTRRRALAEMKTAVLAPDAAARLGRAVRNAQDVETITAAEAEIVALTINAKSAHEKRREREIERTRARIAKVVPTNGERKDVPSESWQDVLRRFAATQSTDAK